MESALRPSPFTSPDIAKMRFMLCHKMCKVCTNTYKLTDYDDECLTVLRDYLHLYMKSVLSVIAKQKKMYAIDCPLLTRKCKDDQKGSEKLMPWQTSINWDMLTEDETASIKKNSEIEREAARNKKKMQTRRHESHKWGRLNSDSEANSEDKDEKNEGDKEKASSYYITDYVIPKVMYRGPKRENGTTVIYTLKDLEELLKRNCHVIPRKFVYFTIMKRIALKKQPRPIDVKV